MSASNTTIKKIQAGLLAILALMGYSLILHNYTRAKYYEQGMNSMERRIAECTLADARAERCYIPCTTDIDCVEKNGQEDH